MRCRSRRFAEASSRGEAEGGAHGADGVGAGGADADLEEFEEAGVHGGYCRRAARRLGRAWPMVRTSWLDFFSDCFLLEVVVGGVEGSGDEGLRRLGRDG